VVVGTNRVTENIDPIVSTERIKMFAKNAVVYLCAFMENQSVYVKSVVVFLSVNTADRKILAESVAVQVFVNMEELNITARNAEDLKFASIRDINMNARIVVVLTSASMVSEEDSVKSAEVRLFAATGEIKPTAEIVTDPLFVNMTDEKILARNVKDLQFANIK